MICGGAHKRKAICSIMKKQNEIRTGDKKFGVRLMCWILAGLMVLGVAATAVMAIIGLF